MRTKRNQFTLVSCILALCALGCASTTAPRQWLPRPKTAQKTAFGGWISVNYAEGRVKKQIDGELIAVHPDSIFVLVTDHLIGIPAAQIAKAKLTAFDANTAPLVLWSVLGTLLGTFSTLTFLGGDGVILFFPVPVWIIGGTAATSAQSYAPQLSFPKKSWNDFRLFARFPNGLPPELDRRVLKPK